jgi:hypothetical protein
VMFEVCVLDMLPDDSFEFAHVPEQLLQLMFGTYRPAMYAMKTSNASAFNAQHSLVNRLFTKIVREAISSTGWKIPVRWRESFGKTEGGNWSSPMLHIDNIAETDDIPKRTVYIATATKLEIGTKTLNIVNYRLSKLKVRARDNSTSMFGVIGAKDNLYFKWPTNGPTHLDSVQLIFELRTDGSRHPCSFAGLPFVSCFSDADRACSWALKLQWARTDGSESVTYQMYCYLDLKHTMGAEIKVPGETAAYANGIAIQRYLMQERPAKGFDRKCDHDLYWPTVYEATFDFPRQQLTFARRITSGKEAHRTQRRTFESMKAQMEKAGLCNVGVKDKKVSRSAQEGRSSSSDLCDACVLIRSEECKKRDAVAGSGDGGANCTKCLAYGRPCSYTPGDLKLGSSPRGSGSDQFSVMRNLLLIQAPKMAGRLPDLNSKMYIPSDEDD